VSVERVLDAVVVGSSIGSKVRVGGRGGVPKYLF
jgi:hypothetical protein